MNSLNEIVSECFPGPIDFNLDLFEQGVTSLALLNLVDRVSEEWSTEVDLESFLCEPTIRNLDDIISIKTGESFIANSQERSTIQVEPSTEYSLINVDSQWQTWVESDDFLSSVDPEKELFEYQIMSLRLLGIVDDFVGTFKVEVDIEDFLKQPTLSYLRSLLTELETDTGISGSVSGLEWTAEVEAPKESDSVSRGLSILSSKEEKQGFLDKNLQIRQFEARLPRISVGQLAPKYFNVLYNKRKNSNIFAKEQCGKDQLLNWLHVLSVEMSQSNKRYLYPSAGGTYPVQTYLEVKHDGVSGIDRGAYYFNPMEGCLVRISDKTLQADDHFYYNRVHYSNAHFCLYLVAEMRAIEPIYQQMSASFVAMEAGCISQLLATWQAEHGLTSRILAGANDNKVIDIFQLGDSHKPLITLACGQVQQSVH